MNDIYISDNFKLSEFESPDTKEIKINEELVDKLEQLRKKVNDKSDIDDEIGLIINSAYRTPEHNKSVGGVDNSQHLKGDAADVSLNNLPYDADSMEGIAEEIGFNGIGKYNTFIHLDVRDNGQARWDNRA